MGDPLDVIVIGGGQAGLSAGYYLQHTGLAFRILDAAPRIGDSWRNRYHSLSLFTPRSFSQLPGMTLSGDPEHYPTRLEFAAYLEAYASRFSLPVLTNARVTRLTSEGGRFQARLQDGTELRARAVIIATGAFQRTQRPALGSRFGSQVTQIDADAYRRPDDTPGGRVLVVGDGASGRDIAADLAATRETLLAVGKPRKLFPERILGRSVWWWLRKLGLMRVRPTSRLGRIMQRIDPFPDRGRSLGALQTSGVRVMTRLVDAEGHEALFADGSRCDIDAVIWATGYRDELAWLDVAHAVDDTGAPVHRSGVSPVPGLYVLGRPWQRNRASALVMGAGRDAQILVTQLCEQLRPT
jgi:putative flavoprotein involved in K+ transport